MKRFFAGLFVALTLMFTLLFNPSSVSAQEDSVDYKIQKVCIGHVYKCKYVAKRVGLFRCRTRCVPCWVKVPVYKYVGTPIEIHKKHRPESDPKSPGPGDIGGVEIRGESGAEVTASQQNVGNQ